MAQNGERPMAQHLCVLVHGFYGAPDNMQNIAKTLLETHGSEKLHILVAKSNSGSFTSDGIDRGAERLCTEIEEELGSISSRDGKVTKFSIIGFSLGGLIARYALGLLHANGFLDTVECMNFTTFASPHLGVRNPLGGMRAFVWNVLASRSLSISGMEMFAIDKFRDTGKPVLALLADPDSIFMGGLRPFKRRTLYCNITNDMNTDYYTTSIRNNNPYADLSGIKANYLAGYDSVMLNPTRPVLMQDSSQGGSRTSWVKRAFMWMRQIPYYLALPAFAPIFVFSCLVYSFVETARSNFRISRHESGAAGIRIQQYRVPPLVQNVRRGAEQILVKTLGGQQGQELVPDAGDTDAGDGDQASQQQAGGVSCCRGKQAELPPLALDANQRAMIEGLDTLDWRRYPVWIQKQDKAHEAIVVCFPRKDYEEGYVVLRHYATEEFLV